MKTRKNSKEPEYRPIWVPNEIHAKIKQLAELEDRTIVAYMRRVVDRELAAIARGHDSPGGTR